MRNVTLLCTLVFYLFQQFVGADVAMAQNPTVLINELMASNSSVIADEDGDSSDWVELYNSSDQPVNLVGWGLSDNPSNLYKWIFPEVMLAPGEYLLVWASGKDRAASQTTMRQGIQQEVYLDISGMMVSDLINSPNYPNSPSYSRVITNLFEAPIDVGDDYGQRLHGLLKAPATGDYIFWISGDDNSQLFLSTDEQPFNAQKIAEVPDWTNSREWNKYPQQKSAPIHLVEGQYYYISALMKEAAGGDNLAIGWEMPNGTVERPMPASHIFTAPGELHTNFSISADGEQLTLTNKLGEIVHLVPETKQTSNISYGLMEGKSGFYFFDEPTPGTKNSATGFTQVLDTDVEFSHSEGFYTQGFNLTLSSPHPDVTIYYTLDGSEPSPSNLSGTNYSYKNNYSSNDFFQRETKTYIYNQPIPIINRTSQPYILGSINTRFSNNTWLPQGNYFKGTVVRAKAVKNNALSPYSSTHTFFVTPEGSNKYNLPIISLATDEAGLFDYEQGIYVAGKVATDWVASHPGENWDDGRPANYNQRGQTWERAAHFEYFKENSNLSYHHNVGLRVHGGWSRANARKSLRIYARSSYGTGDRLDYPFFGELKAKGNPELKVKDFRRLILRNSGNDHDYTLYRDALMHRLVDELPFATMATQAVIHFINGDYWGIMNLRERYDKYYLESHYGVSPENIAILDCWGNIEEGYPDDRNHFFNILNFAESNNLSIKSNFDWIKERVDTESLAQYYAAQIYFYNTDWPQNNMTFWRNRAGTYSTNTPAGLDGRWSWMLYDTDFGMSLWEQKHHQNGLSRVMNSGTNDPSSRLFRQLLKNQEFKNYFINAVADQLNSSFKPTYISKIVDEFNSYLSSSRAEHYSRWNSGRDEGWVIKDFGNKRPTYVRTHTRQQFTLSADVQLIVSTQGGGNVKVNSLLINNQLAGIQNSANPYPWEGTYFRSTPIKLEAVNNDGYKFSHWLGVSDHLKTEQKIELTLSQNSSITAVFTKAETRLIHYWHFNNLESGTITEVKADQTLQATPGYIYYPGTGNGYMDRVTEGSSLNTQNNIQAGNALRVRNPSNNRHLDIEIPTTGYEAIRVSYAVTRTNKGAETQSLYYRTSQNGTWIPYRENIPITEEFTQQNLDFSQLAEANNNDYFALRIAFTGQAASGTSGNNRFDNIAVFGYGDTTKIEAPESQHSFTVYPIPATTEVNIISAHTLTSVELSDLKGRKLRSEPAKGYTHTTNVSTLPQGLYLLTVKSQGKTENIKLIIK